MSRFQFLSCAVWLPVPDLHTASEYLCQQQMGTSLSQRNGTLPIASEKIVTEERFYLNEIGLREDLCRGIRKKPSELALHLVRKGRFAPSEKTHQAWKIRVELPEGL